MTREKLKQDHLKQIFLYTRETGVKGISRAELKQKLKLAFPSVTALVDELIEKKLIIETGETNKNYRGRPRTMIKINPEYLYIPVFELKAEGYNFVLYDLLGNSVLKEEIEHRGRKENYDVLWQPSLDEFCLPVINKINDIKDIYPLSDIVISLPGNLHKSGTFKSTSVNLETPPKVFEYAEEKTGFKIHTINCADSLVCAEIIYGNVPENYLYLDISRGFGAGIIYDGRPFLCGPSRAGEIGHISIDYKGIKCRCGSRGCIERYINTDVITEEVKKVLPWVNDFEEVSVLYKDGNKETEEIINNKTEILIYGINNVFLIHPVADVIIGGKIKKLGNKFLSMLCDKVEEAGSRIYKGKVNFRLSENINDDMTIGAYYNYINDIMIV